ncbi:response regulator [Nocardia tengchongensis]|uniref:response regulator n=1 Tax=Nocardia tengchongensis TaxID=2055889 RepID=UPI0036BA9119
MIITVLIVDDQAMVRTGFTTFLSTQPDIDVVGEAADGQDAVRRAAELEPDVVLMDVRMPVMDGLEATRAIMCELADPPKVLVLTTFDLDDYVYAALRAGASGFLLKDASADQLADAVRVIAAGNALLAPSVTRRMISEFTRLGPRRSHGTPTDITNREAEVLTLVAQGLTNREIAAQLVLSEHTVKTHVARILTKLGLRDRAQMIIYAYETGLVRPGR